MDTFYSCNFILQFGKKFLFFPAEDKTALGDTSQCLTQGGVYCITFILAPLGGAGCEAD